MIRSGVAVAQHSDIKERILADIASGTLPFGARLTLDDLAARYDASHMPIREAVRGLQGAGVLETGPGRSARVRQFNAKFIEELFSTRAALETMLVRQAAQLITPAQLRQLETIEDEMEASLDAEDYTGALTQNRLLHGAINDIASNPEAVGIINRHWWLIGALWQRVGYAPERYTNVVSDHRHLLHAFRRNDVDAAGTLMGAHVIKAKFDLLNRLEVLRATGTSPIDAT
nr:GntR family transcriptional regulator [Sphingomonas sp. R-74633]